MSGPVTCGWGDDRSQRIIEQANQAFEAALSNGRSTADALLFTLSGLRSTPDDVTVEFPFSSRPRRASASAHSARPQTSRLGSPGSRAENPEAGREEAL